jgi:putative restriction endonuclease
MADCGPPCSRTWYAWPHSTPTAFQQFDNRALRAAMSQNRPLAYFVGVARGVYHPQFPVYVLAEDQPAHEFVRAVDEGQRFVRALEDVLPAERRAYVQRLTRLRLHQPVFRARVLRAYGSTCAMCRLRHAELLDAAHILPDHLGGQPIVPNGLSLCKIHHAAYDQNIVGVRPDLVIKVPRDILDEVDGPMLRHGLQEMDGGRIIVPKARDARPDPGALEERFAGFRAIA